MMPSNRGLDARISTPVKRVRIWFLFLSFLNLAGPMLELGLEKRQPNGNQKTEQRQKE